MCFCKARHPHDILKLWGSPAPFVHWTSSCDITRVVIENAGTPAPPTLGDQRESHEETDTKGQQKKKKEEKNLYSNTSMKKFFRGKMCWNGWEFKSTQTSTWLYAAFSHFTLMSRLSKEARGIKWTIKGPGFTLPGLAVQFHTTGCCQLLHAGPLTF